MKQTTRRQTTILIALLFASLLGCNRPSNPTISSTRSQPRIITQTIGFSVQNRPIEKITYGSGPIDILFIATIHGNESVGTPLMYQLIEHMKRTNIHNTHTVTILPKINPDGFALNQRYNANNIDLNRNFPADNRINNKRNGLTALSEPESQILHNLILKLRPQRIITLHQPLYCIDYDGPADGIAKFMSRFSPLPVKKLGSRPGSLGSFAGLELNIPIITVEYAWPDSKRTPKELWTLYGTSLMAAITYPRLPYEY